MKNVEEALSWQCAAKWFWRRTKTGVSGTSTPWLQGLVRAFEWGSCGKSKKKKVGRDKGTFANHWKERQHKTSDST